MIMVIVFSVVYRKATNKEFETKYQPHHPYCHPQYDHSRCVVLVALGKDAKVIDEWFEPKQHPLHPSHARLEEPDQLVDVVPRDLLRLVQQEN